MESARNGEFIWSQIIGIQLTKKWNQPATDVQWVAPNNRIQLTKKWNQPATSRPQGRLIRLIQLTKKWNQPATNRHSLSPIMLIQLTKKWNQPAISSNIRTAQGVQCTLQLPRKIKLGWPKKIVRFSQKNRGEIWQEKFCNIDIAQGGGVCASL